MEDRVNKPKVFLSHAWEDKAFIERIAADLRRCSIEGWLDTEKIRDGRSWLKMIFEDGIPTCDAVIVYLTDQSIRSKMVQKELDAAVVQQLSEGGVTLLPYVSEASLRGQLRSDIQTLHCREWNSDNYDSILPTVVAEIWRSYLERTVQRAVLPEKSRRLQQELENKRLKEQYESSVFSAREEQEFRYLHEQLSRKIEVRLGLFKKKDRDQDRSKVGEEVCRISVLDLLLAAINNGGLYFDRHFVGYQIVKALGETLEIEGEEVTRARFGNSIDNNVAGAIQTELNTFGLTTVTKRKRLDRWEAAYEISEKMYRFKYWIEYNHLMSAEPVEHVVMPIPEEPTRKKEEEEKDRATAQAIAADKRISQTRRRKAWSTNGEGTFAASADVQGIFDELRDRAAASNEVVENMRLEFRSELHTLAIKANDVTLNMRWNCPSSNIADCGLNVLIDALGSKAERQSDPRQLFSCEFGLKVSNELELVWKREETSHDSFSSSKLTDFLWSTFMHFMQRNEEEMSS